MHPEIISPDLLKIFTLVFVRLGIVTIVLPAGIALVVPIRWRITLAAFVSLLVALPKQEILSSGMNVELPVAIFQEALLGLSLAMMISCFFFAFQMAGQLISQITGGSLVHPTAASPANATPLGTLFMLHAVVLFLATGSHRSVVDVVLNSVTDFPPGVGWRIENSLAFLIDILDFSFRVAIHISAPIVFCLIGTTLFMSLLAKLVSYFGFFTIGLSINTLVALLTLLICIPAIVLLTRTFSQEAVELTTHVFQYARP